MNDDKVVFGGVVTQCLPNTLFRIKLENDHEVIGHLSGKMRRFKIKVLQNDRVDVEMSGYDLSKGRIIHRYK
tara:strand:+ start:585 stop:800 length:216 start_codon:yes stop_codon:yes gene_type:complete